MKEQNSSNIQMVKSKSPVKKSVTLKRSCNSCGHQGHIARYCYERMNNIKKAWKSGLIYPESKFYGYVWVPKSVLYARQMEDEYDDEFDVICNIAQIGSVKTDPFEEIAETCIDEEPQLVCNLSQIELEDNPINDANSLVAYMSSEVSKQVHWYFHSGCSRHMTGEQQIVTSYNEISGGKVTFGDGGKGKIRGVGNIDDPDQLSLINVYYVEGLKANLISVSQLCDEGLRVVFTKTECQAIDVKGNIVLEGIRSANNCYMWKPLEVCLPASESQLDLWHKRIGHMNVNGMQRIVKANVVRGVPKLEESSGTVCKACC